MGHSTPQREMVLLAIRNIGGAQTLALNLAWREHMAVVYYNARVSAPTRLTGPQRSSPSIGFGHGCSARANLVLHYSVLLMRVMLIDSYANPLRFSEFRWGAGTSHTAFAADLLRRSRNRAQNGLLSRAPGNGSGFPFAITRIYRVNSRNIWLSYSYIRMTLIPWGEGPVGPDVRRRNVPSPPGIWRRTRLIRQFRLGLDMDCAASFKFQNPPGR